MTVQLLWNLVVKNFSALRKVIVPFILASSVMFGLEYILLSLVNNDYIQKRHATLPMLISYANILVGLLTIIFVIYANRFVMKQRKQEFALNMILGLEKKHIRLMILMEMIIQMLIIIAFSILGGYLFGNLVFLLLNKLVKGSGITLMNYPFDLWAAGIIILSVLGVFIVLYIFNNIMITRQSPVQLMRTKQAGEKKTRRWIIIICLIVGMIALFTGYYIALTAEGVISSLQKIFLAVFAVLIGTYLLFMSLSIVVLQRLKNNAKFYYQPNHFFSISGLLSRMKANAVSLASITMLVTFLVVTLGMTVTAYRGMESQVAGRLTQDYRVDGFDQTSLKKVEKEINHYAQVDQYRTGGYLFFPIQNVNGDLKQIPKDVKKIDSNSMIYGLVITAHDHNQLHNDHVNVKKGQVLLSANTKRFRNYKNINFAGKKTKVINTEKDYLGNQIAIDGLYIIVSDKDELKKVQNYYKDYDPNAKRYIPSALTSSMEFNIVSGEKNFIKHQKTIEKNIGASIESKDEVKKILYELNGGLIFMGIVVSIVLLTGIFLVLYYKQMSEGFEDRRNYNIMKKIGLPDDLIKSTIHKQILWVFSLPLIVTVIHTLFASKIIYNLLGVLGVRNPLLFITSYIGVMIIIMMIYGLMYLMTSRTYYKIINE